MKQVTRIIIFSLLLAACQGGTQSSPQSGVDLLNKPERDPDKVYNLMGSELPPLALSEEARSTYTENLIAAKKAFEQDSDSLDLIIWYGRRLAYLGNYLDAISVYSEGLRIYPSAYRLYRHRGHRYISTRQLDLAIKDYEFAALYSLNKPNEIEPDGIPNQLNQPLSNDKFNIWYHFGLAYYLSGRYDKALSAYKKCMEFSDNNDLIVATTYWQYLTYKKLGNQELAAKLIEAVPANMKIIENSAYHDLLLLFKGNNNPEELIQLATNEEGMLNPTLAYGIASHYQHIGNFEKANEILLKVLESPSWSAFGYIAAEAELKATFPVP